jgi:endonuclease/exonuclease/phosphatase family metal-dependent hydrolase
MISMHLDNVYQKFLCILVNVLIFSSCEPLVTDFEPVEKADYYSARHISLPPDTFTHVKVMTWNIRFGAGRRPWFGDACGNNVIFTREEITGTLQLITDKINEIKPDILILQEVDLPSKRSGYTDQLRYIFDHSYFNYAVSGAQWRTQFIPSDGLGRLDEENVIFSRWKITDAQRIQLPLRGDQDKLTRYFYERCCIVKCKVDIPGLENFYVLNTHSSAFATDDTKMKHIEIFKDEMDKIADQGFPFIAGGDLNTLPPGSDSTDYCMEDICPGESYHKQGDNPMHKDGSNYTPESSWLIPLYDEYLSAIALDDYLADPISYFTHTTRPDHFWDRTLDYLFSNLSWQDHSGKAHQESTEESDHAPVSAILLLPLR